MLEQTDAITNEVLEAIPSNIPHCIYRVSQNLCHKLFLGIPHPQLSKKSSYQHGSKSEQVQRYRIRVIAYPSVVIKYRRMKWAGHVARM